MTHHKQIAPPLAEGATGNNVPKNSCQPTTSQSPRQISNKQARKQARRIAANYIISCLADLYPNTFAIYQERRKPLKLNIGDDLQSEMGAAYFNSTIAALGIYQQNEFYLRACVEGAVRIDLAGRPAGVVTSEEAAQAAALLASRHAKWKAKQAQKAEQDKAAPPKVEQKTLDPSKPKRLTLADLRAAARARREGKRP